LRAQVLLWTRPRGALVAPLPSQPAAVVVDDLHLSVARRLGVAVRRAAEFGIFRPACLAQAIALHRMIHRRGITGTRVEVGVVLRDRKLMAHAWVRYGDVIASDDPDVGARYTPLESLSIQDAR
jgi:hypothetical protein